MCIKNINFYSFKILNNNNNSPNYFNLQLLNFLVHINKWHVLNKSHCTIKDSA